MGFFDDVRNTIDDTGIGSTLKDIGITDTISTIFYSNLNLYTNFQTGLGNLAKGLGTLPSQIGSVLSNPSTTLLLIGGLGVAFLFLTKR